MSCVYVSGARRHGVSEKGVRSDVNALMLCKYLRSRRALQSNAQDGLIEGELLDGRGAEEMERSRLVCGNPCHFQGDQRDIMFLSMVAAPNERIGSFTGATDNKRFNVAANLARDQMYPLDSVTRGDLSTSCFRRRRLRFFENKGASPHDDPVDWQDLEYLAVQNNRSRINPPPPFYQPGVVQSSWFEVDVALIIHRKRYRSIPQLPIAELHMDMVVEGVQA